jgi:hypothetical protein
MHGELKLKIYIYISYSWSRNLPLLWNENVHYKNPPQIPILSYISPVHKLLPCLRYIIILSFSVSGTTVKFLEC